jgi:hypothetical protein
MLTDSSERLADIRLSQGPKPVGLPSALMVKPKPEAVDEQQIDQLINNCLTSRLMLPHLRIFRE